MSVEREAEVTTLCRSGLVFICLEGGHFEMQKKNMFKQQSLNRGKLKTPKISKNTYPIEM